MVVLLNKILYVYAKNHPVIRWVQCRGNISCIHEKSIAEDLVEIFDEGKTMTLQKISEQRVAFIFCVAEGTFSH